MRGLRTRVLRVVALVDPLEVMAEHHLHLRGDRLHIGSDARPHRRRGRGDGDGDADGEADACRLAGCVARRLGRGRGRSCGQLGERCPVAPTPACRSLHQRERAAAGSEQHDDSHGDPQRLLAARASFRVSWLYRPPGGGGDQSRTGRPDGNRRGRFLGGQVQARRLDGRFCRQLRCCRAIAATPKSRPQPPQYRDWLIRCRPHVGQKLMRTASSISVYSMQIAPIVPAQQGR